MSKTVKDIQSSSVVLCIMSQHKNIWKSYMLQWLN